MEKIVKKFNHIVDSTRDACSDFVENPWKFVLVDLIGLSGLSFLGGIYALSLSAGSAANGSYGYHWYGISLMFASVILSRLGL